MTTDLNTLLTALYVRIDDYLAGRVRAGRRPRLTDSELLTLAVAQVLLDVHSEARWLRLRAALPLLKRVIRDLAAEPPRDVRRLQSLRRMESWQIGAPGTRRS